MKRTNTRRKRKLNNKGMSLVEVLVAMVILSVVSISFIEIFAFSLGLNRDAKVKQYALSFSQSLMESMKAYDREMLDDQFGTGIDNASFRLYPLSSGAGKSFTAEGEKRTYQLSNVEFNENRYDAEIIVTPTTEASQLVNLVSLESVNKYNDGFVKLFANEQSTIIPMISAYMVSDKGADAGTVVDPSKLHFTNRTVTITIDNLHDEVTASVSYDYTVTNQVVFVGGVQDVDHPLTFSSTVTYDYVPAFYSNEHTAVHGAELQNLYIYYYPAYKLTDSGILECDSDNIVINNNSNTLKKIYLLKQKNPELSNDATIANGEATYHAAVAVNSLSAVELTHNLEESLIGINAGVHYSVSGSGVTDAGKPWRLSAETTPLVYDIEINVRQHGSSEVVYQLKGSTNLK